MLDEESRLSPSGRRRLLLYALFFEAGLGLLAVLLDRILGANLLASLGFSATSIAVGVIATVPVTPLLLLLMHGKNASIRRIRKLLERLLLPIAPGLSLPWILALSVAAGVGEELLFRGFLQGGVATLLGPGPALIIVSLVFGMLHAVTPAYAVYATLLGLYLGGLYQLTGSLLVPVVVHALYDAVGLHSLRSRVHIPSS